MSKIISGKDEIMKKIIAVNLIGILFLIITGVYYISSYNDISGKLLRMHVISNSNSEEDTRIKLMVRDRILESVDVSEGTEDSVILKLPEIEAAANNLLLEVGADYRARVLVTKTEIPRKEYNGIVLPKGEYRTLRVLLGKAEGENWWCVCYPPLCFTEEVVGEMSEEGKAVLKDSLNDQSYRMITSDIRYEIKLLEIAKSLLGKIRG